MSTPGKIVALLVALATLYGIYYFANNIVGDNRYATPARPDNEMEYIIDADTANEIDDLFAIVGALARHDRTGQSDGPRLAGLVASQFHTSPLASDRSAAESQAINQDLARLMGQADLRLAEGSNRPLKDARTPRRSTGAAFIAERASLASRENKLQVFVLGSCTNVASALLLDPDLAYRMHVRYLGFWRDSLTGAYDLNEFNTGNDSLALEVLLSDSRLEFTVMTATTSEALQMTREDLATRLPQNERLTKYLLDRWDDYDRWWTDEDPEKTRWTMWDVASLEAWFEPELATLEYLPGPTGREIGVYTGINADAMLDNWFGVVEKWLER